MKDEIKLKDMTDFLENVYKDIKKQPTLEEELEKERKFINKIKGDNEDEIKEILDNMKEISSYEYTTDWFELNYEDTKILLDYITNLQEENHNLKELCDKYEEEHSTAFNLWKTNIIENVPALSDMQQQLEDYKSRIDKAIRTLETLKSSARWERHLYEVDYLLNILNGGDE